MRKFSLLTLLVALFSCFAASAADYYLIGGFNNWRLADPSAKFTQQGNGVYVLNYNGTLTSGFKVNDGTWDNNEVNFGSNGSPLVVGESYTYGTGGMSADIAMSGAVSNPKVTLNVNEGTLLVEGAGATVTTTYAIHGCLDTADADTWVDYPLVEQGGNYVATVNVTNPAAAFGIKEMQGGAQSAWFAATEETYITGATTVSLVTAGGINISIATGTYTLTFNPSASTLTVTTNGGGGGDNPDPNPNPNPNPGDSDYYLIGGFNNWVLADPSCRFSTAGNGVYVLNYNGTLTSGFKVNDGTWDNNEVNFGSNGSPLVVGESYTYGTGGMSADIAMSGAVVNPKVTLDINAGTILVEGSSTTVETTYAIHGNLDTADADTWVDYALAPQNGAYVATVTVTNSDAKFGIKKMQAGNQSAWYAATEAVSIFGDSNISLMPDGENISIAPGTYTFSFSPTSLMLLITVNGGGGGGDNPDPNPNPNPNPGDSDYYLIGGFNNWVLADPSCRFSTAGNGVYKLQYNGILTSGFKVNDGKWSGAVDFGSNGEKLVVGVPYAYTAFDGPNIEMDGAVLNPNITLNVNEGTLLVEGSSTTVETTYAIHGNLDTADADTWVDYPMTEQNGKFVVSVQVTNPAAKFGIRELQAGNQSAWYAASDEANVTGDTTLYLMPDGMNISIATGTYTFTFNPGSMSLEIVRGGTGAVEGIATEAAEAVYYNLNGVRVDNPTTGIYVVRQGDKVTKVIM